MMTNIEDMRVPRIEPKHYISERRQIILQLIGSQDVRKWNVQALYEWARSMADVIMREEK